MKKSLFLSVVALSLAACSQAPTPHPVDITYLGPLTITEQAETTTVSTKSAAVFSWSDNRGLSATNRIYPGAPRVLPSGSAFGLQITLGE